MKKPIAFLSIMIVSILMLYWFYPEIFTFTDFRFIRTAQTKWIESYHANPIKILSIYFIFNALMAMMPVPGISMISFLGGALFGLKLGFLLSSTATALGNLGGFYLARTFLHDWVMQKYGERVSVFKKDWQTNGALTLFSMRLFPLIPSFVANLIMGVSPLHWWTFFWVGWLGRIPMVLFYTLAGVQVATIKNVEDILSAPVFVSFGLLAVAPWVLKWIWRKMKVEKSV